jgi:hypothetical protein
MEPETLVNTAVNTAAIAEEPGAETRLSIFWLRWPATWSISFAPEVQRLLLIFTVHCCFAIRIWNSGRKAETLD